MKKIVSLPASCPLFAGLKEEEIHTLLDRMDAKERACSKEEVLFSAGSTLREIGVVLSGRMHILKEDFEGNAVLLAQIPPGGVFGEAFAFSGEALTVTAIAGEDSRVLLLDCEKALSVCPSDCDGHRHFLSNMLRLFAGKNLFLTGRIEHLSKRSLREKVLSYLHDCAEKSGGGSFTISLDRQGMADYLAADRSALSYVLSGLRREGVIDYRKNRFTLL